MPRVERVSADDVSDTRYGDAGRVAACGLSLAPFRGLRYDPERVTSLGAVTSPPYDVVDPDGRTRLEDSDPHNVVRLILPRPEPTAEDGYRHAATLLDRWQRQGVLRPDPEPALYVYEQRTSDADGGLLQRGLIGALAVSDARAGMVLPHEDVMPRPVADRVGLMRTTKANLEPLLLTYRGDGRAAAVVERTAQRDPLLETTTSDGTRHRLWAVTERDDLTAVSADLATCRALIADGHHRWAMYLRLQREHRHLAQSPWDRGMVLLVDTAAYPLRVRAIHRVLQRLPLRDALERLRSAGGDWRLTDLGDAVEPALKALATAKAGAGARGGSGAHDNAFLLAGDGGFHLLTGPDETALAASVPADLPEEYRRLDATVLHALLLERVWRVPDDPEHIGYLHDTGAAIREAVRANGTAVLLNPVEEGVVRRLAEQGVTMPRKSTSFGPKPATGLVLRNLRLG
ncbi:DUF1015 domain-containing protein [Streptacidiphilus pinicola]|uniref:DUF1015 domain-containing protein n=1 Tax=Streptacidiphilus pinicola TaxID=2219663 RepID=A0A2X0ICZ4_9ACTN|nr:DUF1015 domain-containing protein [Streptacidiphilus pinicola]